MVSKEPLWTPGPTMGSEEAIPLDPGYHSSRQLVRFLTRLVDKMGLFPSVLLVTALAAIVAAVFCRLIFVLYDVYTPGAAPGYVTIFAMSVLVPCLVTPLLASPLVQTIRSLTKTQQRLNSVNKRLQAQIIRSRELEAVLIRRATTDELTGLYNRRAFFESVQKELARVRRSGVGFSLLLMDIDFFKQVNDTYGHAAGDAVLRVLADTLRSTLRVVDVAARMGGEEFAILLPETQENEAHRVAERLRQAIAAAEAHVGVHTIRVTISIGVAALSANTPDPDTLLHAADEALYAAKARGRDQVVLADAP